MVEDQMVEDQVRAAVLTDVSEALYLSGRERVSIDDVVPGVASRETRVERRWVMRDLVPRSRVALEVNAGVAALQAKWLSRRSCCGSL